MSAAVPPPKPKARPDHVSLWHYMRLFRRDILSAQPARLYHAWMAEFRTPFFHSYLINDPDLIRKVLIDNAADYPKSDRITAGLRPLLGQSIFVTNGQTWTQQRRIITPAFAGGRLHHSFAAMVAAAEAGVARLGQSPADTPQEIEAITSHIAADVIFRTLFSIPITDDTAWEVFNAFRRYQRAQPVLSLAALLRAPAWMPRLLNPAARKAARTIRRLITRLTHERLAAIAAGTAPDDLATKILTTKDPVTGQTFTADEMVDQVAIFFLAGHETSASALAWCLYLLATHPGWQMKLAQEAALFQGDYADIAKLSQTRDVFRETLRLYPPVPMMVREATQHTWFRQRRVCPGAQVVVSPWHLHRHTRLWDNPDMFDPTRWHADTLQRCPQQAYLPFSAGPRICPGAGFAMTEALVILARLLQSYEFHAVAGKTPVPVAHLTVRSEAGIWLKIKQRQTHYGRNMF